MRAMLDYAQRKTAVDYARADRRLDGFVVQVRHLFERFDVLLLPTTPMTPPPIDAPEPGNVPDFTALASLGGCPALSIPLGEGIGLQLVGAPGSDLRLLELGEILAAVLDATD
jgi:Asp-tRNA(Asn)/Glu-tRNA(Gln) amidotransferase A subunit family amidase